jgi:glycosyltransferase involved in cell wall biosynthesis
MNRLKEIGLENNVTLFPHGVTFIDDLHISITETNAPLTLGTYGFFLPPKGFDKLISAVSILHDRGTTVNLHMINAEFPDITSRVAIDNAQKQILDLNLQDHIVLDTRFLTDIESFSKLQETDVIVFPYQNTAESASGAVRQALALNLPVVTTPLKIFEDVKNLTLTLSGTTPEDIANGLEPIVKSLKDVTYNPTLTKQIGNLHQSTTKWRQTHAYQVLAQRLWNIIKA